MGALQSLRRTMWRRHLHPASGWTRLLVACGLMVALWHHAWPWIGVALLALLTNPFWFPIAKRVDNFMSRAVLGELIWLRRTRPGAQALAWLAGLVLAVALAWTLWTQRLVPSLALAVIFTGAKLAFLAWCGRLPARHPDLGEQVIAEVVTQRTRTTAAAG